MHTNIVTQRYRHTQATQMHVHSNTHACSLIHHTYKETNTHRQTHRHIDHRDTYTQTHLHTDTQIYTHIGTHNTFFQLESFLIFKYKNEHWLFFLLDSHRSNSHNMQSKKALLCPPRSPCCGLSCCQPALFSNTHRRSQWLLSHCIRNAFCISYCVHVKTKQSLMVRDTFSQWHQFLPTMRDWGDLLARVV